MLRKLYFSSVELTKANKCPVTGQVAGVDQDVAVGDIEGFVESVCVCNGDEFHGIFLFN